MKIRGRFIKGLSQGGFVAGYECRPGPFVAGTVCRPGLCVAGVLCLGYVCRRAGLSQGGFVSGTFVGVPITTNDEGIIEHDILLIPIHGP